MCSLELDVPLMTPSRCANPALARFNPFATQANLSSGHDERLGGGVVSGEADRLEDESYANSSLPVVTTMNATAVPSFRLSPKFDTDSRYYTYHAGYVHMTEGKLTL
jgi:hypothetical protein